MIAVSTKNMDMNVFSSMGAPGSQIMTMAPCRMDTEKMSHSEHYTVTVPVETLCGRIFEVEVNTPTPTILELRESIHEFLGIPMEAQRLSVDTKFYNDNDVIQVNAETSHNCACYNWLHLNE